MPNLRFLAVWWLVNLLRGGKKPNPAAELKGHWYVLQCKCRICNYQWIGVIEEEQGATAAFGKLECNRCGGRNSDWFDIYGKGELK
jgi:hypothetical protein